MSLNAYSAGGQLGAGVLDRSLGVPLSVQICPCYVNLTRESGGVSNIVRQICLQLAASQRQVLLLCGNTDLGRVVAAPGHTSVNQYLTVQVFRQRPHPILGPTGRLRAALRSLPQQCVAHVHTCFSAFSESAMAELSRLGIPFVFTPHGKLSEQMMGNSRVAKRAWWSAAARRYVRRASIIAVSGSAEPSLFPSLGLRQPFVVIPNGYEAPVAATSDVPSVGRPYVLFLGYLDPRKQPEFLVRAFAQSKACGTHALAIVGPDAYGHEPVIRRAIDSCGIAKRVTILGPVYGEDKWMLLRHAACLCLPSRGEGLPVVLCEALGAGAPIVYSKACNFPEIRAQGAGIELDGFVEGEWADAIDRVCLGRDAETNMRAAALRMGAELSWERIVARWADLYDGIWTQIGVVDPVSSVGQS
jgi:glycosyltransferase involved in cell wall biosynthesis